MKALILAAGYGTRMGSLGEKTAKSLLPLEGKPIIDYLLMRLEPLNELESVFIVTNDRYFKDFIDWNEKRMMKTQCSLSISIINDHTSSNEERLGAIRDLALGVEQTGIDSAILVAASDNVYFFDFQSFVQQALQNQRTTITLYKSSKPQSVLKSGNAQINSEGKVIRLIEKPQKPISNLISPCLYIITPKDLPLIQTYIENGENLDAPGYFISWLVQERDVHAYIFREPLLSVGSLESYRKAISEFKNLKNNQLFN
jgi:glucose-1-phosphate thymidylyltransferase